MFLILRKILLATLICFVTLAAAVFAGPVSSGAVFFLLSFYGVAEPHELPEDYEPLHRGGIDLPTGLYVRQNEDLVVRGTPTLILRRTYLSGYQVQREFGIGTTHNGEWYLHGDGQRFQWASLILPNGSRINFSRISPGNSFLNAI
jgi:hypothetical protein